MKTTKQIADVLGASKQQVYRYIKKHCIKEAYQENGTMYYDETAVTLIIQGFFEKNTSTEAEQKRINDTAIEAVISMLQKELEAKDKQIEELQAALKREQELHTSAQRLHDQAQQLHLGSIAQLEAPKGKKGWFKGWKKSST